MQAAAAVGASGDPIQSCLALPRASWAYHAAVLCCEMCCAVLCTSAYEAGSKVALKSSTIPVPTTRYTDDNYQPGKSYEFYIYARCVMTITRHDSHVVLDLQDMRIAWWRPLGTAQLCSALLCMPFLLQVAATGLRGAAGLALVALQCCSAASLPHAGCMQKTHMQHAVADRNFCQTPQCDKVWQLHRTSLVLASLSKTSVKLLLHTPVTDRPADCPFHPVNGSQSTSVCAALSTCRNPSAGAMGNGVGLRSQPIMAPVAAVPL